MTTQINPAGPCGMAQVTQLTLYQDADIAWNVSVLRCPAPCTHKSLPDESRRDGAFHFLFLFPCDDDSADRGVHPVHVPQYCVLHAIPAAHQPHPLVIGHSVDFSHPLRPSRVEQQMKIRLWPRVTVR